MKQLFCSNSLVHLPKGFWIHLVEEVNAESTRYHVYIDQNEHSVIPDVYLERKIFYCESDAYMIAYTQRRQKHNLYVAELHSHWRGRKFASILLNCLCAHFYDKHPEVQYIELDDATNVKPPRNLYYRLGFRVRNKSGKWLSWSKWLMENPQDPSCCPGPERRIRLSHLLRNIFHYMEQ